MNLFISQAMKGKTEAEILVKREAMINYVKKSLHESCDINVLCSFDPSIEEAYNASTNQKDKDKYRILGLANAIKALASADLVIFEYPGVWNDSFGCSIEKQLVDRYNIKYTIYVFKGVEIDG